MKVIIEGAESEVAKVVRENSIRERRGLITITPLTDDAEGDSKDVDITDSKEVSMEEKPKVKTTKTRKG